MSKARAHAYRQIKAWILDGTFPPESQLKVVRMIETAQKTGRDVGAYILCMLIMADTAEDAMAKWEWYKEEADMGP